MSNRRLPYVYISLLFVGYCILGWFLTGAVFFLRSLQHIGPMLFGLAQIYGFGALIISLLAILAALGIVVDTVKNLVNKGFSQGVAVGISLLTAILGISVGVAMVYTSRFC